MNEDRNFWATEFYNFPQKFRLIFLHVKSIEQMLKQYDYGNARRMAARAVEKIEALEGKDLHRIDNTD